jgi:hypothetical protein
MGRLRAEWFSQMSSTPDAAETLKRECGGPPSRQKQYLVLLHRTENCCGYSGATAIGAIVVTSVRRGICESRPYAITWNIASVRINLGEALVVDDHGNFSGAGDQL